MKKHDEILRQQEIIKCYEAIAKNSDKLIQAQKEKIEILEEQVKIHKEAVEKLSEMHRLVHRVYVWDPIGEMIEPQQPGC